MDFSRTLTITRKELRSYFLSPVALLFLGAFLAVTLFLFFTYSKFFARNLADVRPLFEWLPVLLIFLVSALTMRQWSEEKKMGTLEVLMTLPVGTGELVLGKFLAGMVLVVVALGLTLPLPATAAYLGDLDFGPVMGGYIAALLLASTYMAIGLCVSSRTDNQIVALMVSCLLGGLIYTIGTDSVTGLFGQTGAELLRNLGTGSRFASIERGVLDIRDLLYYGSLTLFFLVVNVTFLEESRVASEAKGQGAARRTALRLTMGLVFLNVMAANFWMAPVTGFRADLTANKEYSVSPATARISGSLTEPLEITGYFSAKTHPLLAPLVPRIRNLLEEYKVIGGGKVRITTVDPNSDEEVEKELQERYGIKSVPFRVASRHERAVVNSYFHVLVRYGDEHVVLSFDDLIEVFADEVQVQVKLKNLEYDLTRAIKKVSQGFQSLEAVMARSKQQAVLTAYVSNEGLPKEYAEVPDRIEKVAAELAESTGGRFRFELKDPSGDPDLQQEIFQKYGFRPMAADLFGTSRFYMHLLFAVGDKLERIIPQGELTEANLKTSIEAAIKRSSPGFLKTVGLLTKAVDGQPNPYQPPPQPDFNLVEKELSEEYQFRRVKLDDGVVPGDIDVLLVAKADSLDEKQRFAVDQYLMRGGAVVVFQGAYDVDGELKATKAPVGLSEMLATYGVTVESSLIMDPNNARFPIPTVVKRGPFNFQTYKMLAYPFFPDIRKDGFKADHLTLSGVPSVAMTWSSPLKIAEDLKDRTAEVLLKTSVKSWVHTSADLQPNFTSYPQTGFLATGDNAGRKAVAVAMVGQFPSFFAERPSPLFEKQEGEEAPLPEGPLSPEALEEAAENKEDRTGRTLKLSTPDARLVVVSSSSFASDMIAGMDFRSGTDSFGGNLVLVKNLVDWAVADTDLLEIRSAGKFARTLKPMTNTERENIELMNYGVVLLALLAVGGVALTRRRMATPMRLV